MIRCDICHVIYADNYYKNKDTGEIICEDCDGNRITITKEEQRIIDDYISPVKHIDWKK